MYPPISWMRATGEPSCRRISSSTAFSSSPTSAATRSLRTRSSVGVGKRRLLLGDDSVANLDGESGRDGLDLGNRKLLARLGHPRDGYLLIKLAKDFSGHGVHDGNLVAAKTDDRARPHAVDGREVDHDAGRVDEDDVPPFRLRRRWRDRRHRGAASRRLAGR